MWQAGTGPRTARSAPITSRVASGVTHSTSLTTRSENQPISRTSTAQPAPDAVTGIWPNPRPITKAETGGFGDQAPLAGATPPLKREVSQQRHCSFMIETYASHYGMFFENAVKFAN